MQTIIKLFAIPLVLLIGFYTPDVVKQFNKSLNMQLNSMNTIRPLEQYCMLSTQECIQDSIAITLSSNKVKPMVASKISVKWQESNTEELNLTMQGLEGELGTVRYKLKHVGNNLFEGQITLPICTLDKMTWIGELTDGDKIVYPALRMEI